MATWIQHTFLAVLLLVMCRTTYAQAQAPGVRGAVRSQEGDVVPFANVLLYALPDSAFVKGVAATPDGQYHLPALLPGRYYLTATSVGYEPTPPVTFTLHASGATLARDLTLVPLATQMQEVVIEGQKPLMRQEAGVISVDINQSTLNAGKSLAEALKRVPGVTVDKDGQVSVKGRQGVLVMLDDKPLYMDANQIGALLKSIPADQVRSIEVLTSPSAKYDAAGNAGIIHIKLEKGAYEGLTGSVRSSYGKGVYAKANAGGDVAYKKKKLTLGGSYQYNYDKNLDRFSLARQYRDSTYFTHADNASPKHMHNAMFNGNYELSTRGKLSWDGNFTQENTRWMGTTNSHLYASGESTSHLETKDDSKSNMHALNAGLAYTHALGDGDDSFSALADYKTSSSHDRQTFTTTYFDGAGIPTGEALSYRSSIPVDLSQWSVKADLKRKLPFAINLETGLKHNAIHTRSNIDNTLTGANHFDYQEDIEAGYVMVNRTFGKWKTDLGLRAEHTRNTGIQKTTDTTFSRAYTNLFPNGSISYQATGNTLYTLLYSKRIDRPDYRELNPFSYYSDPNTIFAGNPYLLPQYTHTIEFTLSAWQGAFMATLNYANIQQPHASVLLLDKGSLATIATDANLNRAENYGISLSANVPVTPWWTATAYGYLFDNRIHGDVGYGNVNLSRWTWLINTTQSFTLPKGISADISYMYEAPHYYGTMLYGSVWELSAGVQKKVLKERMLVKVSATDVFWSHQYVGRGIFGETITTDRFAWDNRVLQVSVSYRLGRRLSWGDEEKSGEASSGGRRR